MSDECSGNELTEATDSTLDSIIEKAHIEKGKGRLSEDKYNELIDQADSIRDANKRIKCIVDNIPKETVSPESIISEVDEKIGDTNE